MAAKTLKKQAIGYVRVSTADQTTDGVSLAAQREKVKAYCDLHGLELVTIHADEGLSGKRADNRPGLQRALADVCQRKAVLIVYSLSRLARSTRDCIALSERLEKCGADVASITEKLDTTSSMGRFFFTLMAALGQLERDQVSERTIAAMGHMRQQNRRISRHIPYGYNLAADGKSLRPSGREAAVISTMQAARKAGKSYDAIAEELNARRVPPKAGKRWYASAVHSVLLRHSIRAA